MTKLESEKQIRAAQEVHVSPIPAFPIPAFSIPATLAVAEPVGVADAAGLLLTASASRRGLEGKAVWCSSQRLQTLGEARFDVTNNMHVCPFIGRV